MKGIFEQLKLLNGTFIVTDIASAKEKIGNIGKHLFNKRYTSSHPIAGSERSGLGVSINNLFKVRID